MDYSLSSVYNVYFCFMAVRYEVLECLFSLQNSENAVLSPLRGQQLWLYLLYLVKMEWSQSMESFVLLLRLVRLIIYSNNDLSVIPSFTSLVLTAACTSSSSMRSMPSASREGAWLAARESMTLSSTSCCPKSTA